MDLSVFAQLNWLAVFVAALAYFALGALWFSKALFAGRWVQYHGIDVSNADASSGMARIMTTAFVLMLLATIGLAVLVERLGLHQAISGIKLGLFTGFLFSFAAISITYLFIKKPMGLHLIDGLYHVVGQVIAAVILCIWQ